jgi:hypothetical protein
LLLVKKKSAATRINNMMLSSSVYNNNNTINNNGNNDRSYGSSDNSNNIVDDVGSLFFDAPFMDNNPTRMLGIANANNNTNDTMIPKTATRSDQRWPPNSSDWGEDIVHNHRHPMISPLRRRENDRFASPAYVYHPNTAGGSSATINNTTTAGQQQQQYPQHLYPGGPNNESIKGATPPTFFQSHNQRRYRKH